jgi:hypothetical protein
MLGAFWAYPWRCTEVCPKIATRFRACVILSIQITTKSARMREFSSRFLDNQPENFCSINRATTTESTLLTVARRGRLEWQEHSTVHQAWPDPGRGWGLKMLVCAPYSWHMSTSPPHTFQLTSHSTPTLFKLLPPHFSNYPHHCPTLSN